MNAIKPGSAIIWERKDGLYSAAILPQGSLRNGFKWFASDFVNEGEARAALPSGEVIVLKQSSITEEERDLVNINVGRSAEALTFKEIASVPFGTTDLSYLTKNETTVLRTFHDYEYMDDGLDTELNYDWAVSEGVQGSTGVTARGASGVISSLVKKGYFVTQDNGPGEDDFIIFNESARTVNRLLNADS